MNTLAEIEAAVDALPSSEQAALLLRIESKVRNATRPPGKLVMENGRAVLVAPAMTPELVKALLADFP